MLATLIARPFDDKDWIFETKWDGFRVIAVLKRGKPTLFSRNGKDVTSRYPSITKALIKIGHDAVIDGELVALDSKGKSRFQLLQNVLNTAAPLVYCVFDLLFLDGKDLRKKPLLARKEALAAVVPKTPNIRYSAHRWEHGTRFLEQAKKQKLEGIMAKRAAGLYHSGQRTREWLKIKTVERQEVVIVGFTEPRGSRKYFGALVLAVREGEHWRYVGRAGTGFNTESLREIHAKLLPLTIRQKPVDGPVPNEKHTTWVRPELVGEVKFTEWTTAGEMRHPAFAGLREDKRAIEVVRESDTRGGKAEPDLHKHH
jgi:bifunctional non-homologous end joining protein LigD